MEQNHTTQPPYSPRAAGIASGDARQEVQISQEVVNPQKPWLKIVLFLFLGVFLFAGLVFAGYQLAGPKQIQPTPQPTPTTTITPTQECRQDNNCVLAIRTDQCCSCPEAVTRETLKTNKNLTEYEFGKNPPPPPNLQEKCNRADCQPCPLWEKAICESGRCQGIEAKESQTENKVFCQNPRPQVCTMECLQNPPYICGSDGKSYCSSCQACANQQIKWYTFQEASCGENNSFLNNDCYSIYKDKEGFGGTYQPGEKECFIKDRSSCPCWDGGRNICIPQRHCM